MIANTRSKLLITSFILIPVITTLCITLGIYSSSAEENQAQQILNKTGIQGGVIIHVGCGDGHLTAALHVSNAYTVHGLALNSENEKKARDYIQSLGIYGQVSVDQLHGNNLPYINNFANLVVLEKSAGNISIKEIMRVLCPEGVAYIRKNGKWTKTLKPRPKEIDEWTHYLHDASNNAVSHDEVVGPPSRLQWIGGPTYGRHHDRLSSLNALVTSGGRIFYIFDEASRYSILVPPKWRLIARDAFNGTILWKRRINKWQTHLWPLKSGPAQLPRRLVASGNRVYVTLGFNDPLSELDGATGKTIRTYKGSRATEEIILGGNRLYLLVNKDEKTPEFANMLRINKAYRGKFWNGSPNQIKAFNPATGELLWSREETVLPGTLAYGSKRVFFHNGERVVCLNGDTGKELWHSEPVPRASIIESFYLPILVVYKDILLFSGGETAGLQTGSWYMKGNDTMRALSIETGKVLWKAYHPPSGYRSPEDLFVASGLVWTGETTSGRASGIFTGRDPHTGDVKFKFPPNINTYWFHHRCYRGKATDNYLLIARAGTEFIDVHKKTWTPNYWIRGACLYGVMPANGLLYAPQHPCACYLESKQSGFNAVAPSLKGPRIRKSAANNVRLEKGPAYGKDIASEETQEDWPTYRQNPARSGRASTKIPAKLKIAWQAGIGGKLSSPVIAGGRIFVASVDTHTLYALDAASGKKLWKYTSGGRIDSPPAIYKGRAFFGSADGWVYCLRASDGVLSWRFRAAPMDQRLLSYEQVESVWPVHGNVLILDNTLYFVSGRSMFLDTGLRFWRLDPETGRIISRTVLNNIDPSTGKGIQSLVSWLNMPPALPDILSSDGKLVYMRSQPFNLDGTRLLLKKMPNNGNADAGAVLPTQIPAHAHLFSPTGFLDSSGWHRTYWMYGSTFVSGWCGYYLAGKTAPAGKILVFDDTKVYGFGRKPQYFRWTTPIEFQLFAANKTNPPKNKRPDVGKSRINIERSESLNPANTPITVEAWIKAEKPGGVIIAHGGGALGYALFLKNGQPSFVVRTSKKSVTVTAKKKITGRQVHLAGVLTAENKIEIYVDNVLSSSAEGPGLIGSNPQEGLQIGVDDGSCVGRYNGPFGFKGLIDEIRIYHRALSGTEIKEHGSDPGSSTKVDGAKLVMRQTFDKGDATDSSGNKNNGTVDGASSVKGSMKFKGEFKPSGSQFLVNLEWTKDLPILVQAIVLSDGKLFVAGPPDLINEPEIFRKINTPGALEKLKEQAASLNGKKGGELLVVSAEDGSRQAEYKLACPPVFDGMAAAEGKLYMTTRDGKILCFSGN